MAFTGMDPNSPAFRELAVGFRQRDARETTYCADCGHLITAANDWRYDAEGRRIHRACGK
jgi:hypothetical protein